MIEIIDFHTHIFPEKIAKKTIEKLKALASIPSYTEGTNESLSSALLRAGVGLGVNLPVLTRPEQFDGILEFAKGICAEREQTGLPIISFAGAHPDMDNIEERVHLVRSAGIKGIKVHPDYQGKYFDEEGYIRIARAAKAEGLIMITHAGQDAAYRGVPVKCTPKRVLSLLDKIGGYDKLVLAHYGGNELYDEVYSSLAGEDVYFDTAYVLGEIKTYDFMRILEKHGADKILFATDSPWQDIGASVERIRSFNLGEAIEKKIFAENSKKLLGIAE